jgi:2-dehydropantoate 2-reductase
MDNSVCALTGLGAAASRTTPGVVEVTVRIASEVVKVGRTLGVEVEPINGIPAETYLRADDGQVLEEIKSRLAEGAREQREGCPSMAQDVLKGRRTEIAYLNGYVAARGRETGVEAPVNEAMVGLVKQVERGEIKPDASNIRYLESFI